MTPSFPAAPAAPFAGSDLRRELRLPYRLAVTLLRGREEIPLRTEDVSHHGLFLEIDDALPLRHLVRMRLLLPPYQRELLAHGMTVHQVPRGNVEGKAAGVGVQLYALDRSARSVWSNFVSRVQSGELRRDEAAWDKLTGEAILFLEPEIVDP